MIAAIIAGRRGHLACREACILHLYRSIWEYICVNQIHKIYTRRDISIIRTLSRKLGKLKTKTGQGVKDIAESKRLRLYFCNSICCYSIYSKLKILKLENKIRFRSIKYEYLRKRKSRDHASKNLPGSSWFYFILVYNYEQKRERRSDERGVHSPATKTEKLAPPQFYFEKTFLASECNYT